MTSTTRTGTVRAGYSRGRPATSRNSTRAQGSFTVNIAAGETVNVTGLQFTGGNQTTIAGGSGSLISNYLGSSIAASIDTNTLADIAAAMTSQASGSNPGGIQVSGGGGVQFAGNVTAANVSISAGNAEVVAGATFAAAAISVTGGTLQIDASTNTNQVSAASLDATAGTLNVNGYLNVATSLTVEGTAVLQGTTGTISLASGSLLSYDSSVSSEFDGQINGAGGLSVYAGPNATLTLGGSNGYSGPTAIGGGTVQLANTAIPTDTALSMTGAALLDLNGYDVYVSVLTGGSGDVIANNATTGSLSNLHVGTGSEWTTSTFAGTIADSTNGGPARCSFRLEDYTMYFTGTANNDQYGIQLDAPTSTSAMARPTASSRATSAPSTKAPCTSTWRGNRQPSPAAWAARCTSKNSRQAHWTSPAYTSSYFGFDAQQGTVTFLTANTTAPGTPYCRRRFHAEPRQRGELAGGPRRELDQWRNYQRPVKLHGLTILVLRPH